jgi:hypothetical protein
VGLRHVRRFGDGGICHARANSFPCAAGPGGLTELESIFMADSESKARLSVKLKGILDHTSSWARVLEDGRAFMANPSDQVRRWGSVFLTEPQPGLGPGAGAQLASPQRLILRSGSW